MPASREHREPQHEARAPAASPAPGAPSAAAFDASRADALSFLAGGIAHDLANPLGAILAFASFLATDPRLPADLREDARLLRTEAERTNRITRILLEFARSRPAEQAQLTVQRLVEEVLELERHVLADVDVQVEIPPDLPDVLADPSRLRHLLMVTSVEAIRCLGGRTARGSLRVTARPSAQPGHVSIALAFERAPGAEPVRPGAAAEAAGRAAADLGIVLTAEETATGGRFELSLPAVTEAVLTDVEALTDAPSAASVGPKPGSRPAIHTVLVCEDEEPVRQLLVRILTRQGFRVVPAADGLEALSLLGTMHVDAVLTDHHMRGMSGVELFERATLDRPDLRSRFVVMTGDPGAEDLVQFANGSGVTVLAKPFELHAIAATLREVAQA
ncbi:MAG TPA: response regulator [Candidatus Limnocylindrales bacterium]|nr:response regulator [Candidatus Limnocylindrales bacterium]